MTKRINVPPMSVKPTDQAGLISGIWHTFFVDLQQAVNASSDVDTEGTMSAAGGGGQASEGTGDTERQQIFEGTSEKSGLTDTEVERLLFTVGGGDAPGLLDTDVSVLISESTDLGIHLRTFIKKARDWRSSKPYAQPPKIVLIGDSIANGSWAEAFKLWLCTEYQIPLDNFEIYAYGGYAIEHMIAFVEDIAIFPNPDLIVFGEYEALSNVRLTMIENCIKLFRERTTADVAIYTWSMSDTIAQAYINDSTSLKDDDQYQNFNWYRDIAAKYNCELIDTNEAIKTAIDNGATVASLGMSGPHLSSAGYLAVFLPEFKKHFRLSNDQKCLNLSTVTNKEELIYLNSVKDMDLFSESENITATGTWSTVNDELRSSTNGNTLVIEMEDIIGFEIIHGDDAGASLSLKLTAGGAYANPSTYTYNSRPLQYITKIVRESFGIDGSLGPVFNIPFQKGIITANDLADQYVTSGRYTIKVISIIDDTITCEMFNPADASLGTFEVGQAATFTAGNLSFPQKYNGQDNYLNVDGYNFTVDEIFTFYVKNNWCDTLLSTGREYANCIGIQDYQPIGAGPEDACYSSWDPVACIGRLKYDTDNAVTTQLRWTTPIGLLTCAYKEIDRTYDMGLVTSFYGTSTHNWTRNTKYEVFDVTTTGTSLSFRTCYTDTDLRFKVSIKDMSGDLEYADTKKVFGLERGDYTLRLTVTTGVDLIGIRLLH